MRRSTTAAMLAGPALVLAYGVTGWMLGWHLGSDSAVYRDGALLLLRGRPLYAAGTLGWGITSGSPIRRSRRCCSLP